MFTSSLVWVTPCCKQDIHYVTLLATEETQVSHISHVIFFPITLFDWLAIKSFSPSVSCLWMPGMWWDKAQSLCSSSCFVGSCCKPVCSQTIISVSQLMVNHSYFIYHYTTSLKRTWCIPQYQIFHSSLSSCIKLCIMFATSAFLANDAPKRMYVFEKKT